MAAKAVRHPHFFRDDGLEGQESDSRRKKDWYTKQGIVEGRSPFFTVEIVGLKTSTITQDTSAIQKLDR